MTNNVNNLSNSSEIIDQSNTDNSNIETNTETTEVEVQNIDTQPNSIMASRNLILGGVLLLGIVATILILNGDTNCAIGIFSNCSSGSVNGNSSGGLDAGDFIATASGIGVYIAATTFGVPMLPAVGIGLVIWFLMQIS